MRRSEEIVVDSFAGIGGASLGIKIALGRNPDIAINHDADAIATHTANHPDTEHHSKDIWSVSPATVTKGRPVGLLWASPDCAHFSRAKGSKPVKKEIRSLAWVVCKWAAEVRPRVIILENVREFEDWGPLIPKIVDGKPAIEDDGSPTLIPDPTRKGHSFKRWVGRLRGLGYEVQWRVLNAADYGAPTHRRRLFLIARCDGQPIVWPEPTHGDPKKVKEPSLFGQLEPWRSAAECIDWSLPTLSIFAKKKEAKRFAKQHNLDGVPKRPLAKNTLRRIAMGIKRYVLDSPTPFIVQVNHGGPEFRGQGPGEPLSTVTGKHGYGVVNPELVKVGDGDLYKCSSCAHTESLAVHSNVCPKCDSHTLENIMTRPTIGPNAGMEMDFDQFPAKYVPLIAHIGQTGSNGKHAQSAGDPLTTITSKAEHLIVTPHITKFHGGSVGSDIANPLPTITSGSGSERPAGAPHAMGVVVAQLAHGNGRDGTTFGDGRAKSPDEPLGTVHAGGNNHAVIAATMVQTGYGEREGQSPRCLDLEKPLGTVVNGQKHGLVSAVLVGAGGPAYAGKPRSVEQPNATVMKENRQAVVSAFLAKHYGGVVWQKATKPTGTVTAKDHHSIVETTLAPCVMTNTTEHPGAAADSPLPTQTTGNHHYLASANLVHLNNNTHPTSPADPLHAVTSGGNHAALVYSFLVKYFGTAIGANLIEPAPTATGKDRFGLVQVQVNGEPYVIVDIGMRMLSPRELARAQGFPDSYVLTGAQKVRITKKGNSYAKPAKHIQVAGIGNSVCPVMAKALAGANYKPMKTRRKAKVS